MTESDTKRVGGGRRWRAFVAVFALYGLVLQAMLGGAALAAAPSTVNALCLGQADGTDSSDQAAPGAPGHHHAGCCTLAPAAAVEPPAIGSHPIAWPKRSAARLVWRQHGVVAARAPPDSPLSSRAPPVV